MLSATLEIRFRFPQPSPRIRPYSTSQTCHRSLLRHAFNPSRSNIRPTSQTLHRLPFLHPLDKLLRIEIHTNGILLKRLGKHVVVCGSVLREDVMLSLQYIAVRVVVVQAYGQAVVDAPVGQETFGFALAVGEEEVFQRGECECDVLCSVKSARG